jgi:phage terminase small subunit
VGVAIAREGGMVMPTTYKKTFVEISEEELAKMTREEASLHLNDKQRKWCEEYVNNFNCKIAAKKAGYSLKSAATIGWKLRQNPDVQVYLAWLKLKVTYKTYIRPEDVIDEYARIAFADITDFVTVKEGRASLVNSDMMDGQIVKSIKKSKDGLSIEMHDKMAALDRLERFFEEMPKDWRQKLEERKLSLMEEKLKLDKARMGLDDDEVEDDGFIDALKGVADEVWE